MAQENRLFDFTPVDPDAVQKIFYSLDSRLTVTDIIPVTTGMSTSNYTIETVKGKFLLKVYPDFNDHSSLEIAAYRYASPMICVPEVYYVDNSRAFLPNVCAIFQYIEGMTLRDYVAQNHCFPEGTAFQIGRMLAFLHQRKYACSAFLREDLSIEKPIMRFEHQYQGFLNEFAGVHLSEPVRTRLIAFFAENRRLSRQIGKENVFCHGDINPSNILLDENETPWLIDFEYCFAVPPYYDIGKLFRSRELYTEFIGDGVKANFAAGYRTFSAMPLPDDWYYYAKMADLTVMLAFINREQVPTEWVQGIEEEIMLTIQLITDHFQE